MSCDFERYGKVTVEDAYKSVTGYVTPPGWEDPVLVIWLYVDEDNNDVEVMQDRSINELTQEHFCFVEAGDMLGLSMLVSEVKTRALVAMSSMLKPESNRRKTFFKSVEA